MTISVRGVNNAVGQAVGSVAASTASIAVTLPSGAVSGDRIFITEEATTNTMSTPSGWTSLRLNGACGSGTVASGSGIRYSSVYYRDYDGVWTMPTLTVTSVANISHWVGAIAVTPTASSIFKTPVVTTTGGSFNTATTAYTDTSATAPTIAAGDLIISATTLNDNVTSTTASIGATGATIGTCTERCDGGTGTGFVIAGKIHTAPVTVGTTFVITQTLTLSAASQGETVFIVQGELTPGPAASTRTWDFSAPDTTNWTYYYNTGMFNATGGQGVIGPMSIAADGEYVSTTAGYDMRGSYAGCQLIQTADTNITIFIGLGSILASGPYWSINQFDASDENGLVHRTHVDGDYYRIRESGGTIYYEYSTGGGAWTALTTSLASAYTNINTINCPLWFGAGANTAPGSPQTVKFDNFNIAPLTTNNANFFAVF